MVMPLAERVEAVRFASTSSDGETERAAVVSVGALHGLPCCRAEAHPEVEALVWTIKSWWGVQGVRAETERAVAQALASLDWSEELFAPTSGVPFGAADDASRLVITLVERTSALGAGRRQYLHDSRRRCSAGFFRRRVPVYDDFVRRSLGVPEGDRPQPYKLVAQSVF